LKQTIEILKTDLSKSYDKIAQLEKDNTEAKRQARLDTVNVEQEIEPTKGAEGSKLDAIIAQFEAEKTALGAKSRAWEISAYGATIGLIALLTIIALIQLIKSRKATKWRYQLSEAAIVPAQIQTHFPEDSERFVGTTDVRELNAKDDDERHIKPQEETKPSKSLDEGGLTNQFAETLGVQERTDSLLDLAPAPSESVVPESPAKSGGCNDPSAQKKKRRKSRAKRSVSAP
jgi:hypothetical protein